MVRLLEGKNKKIRLSLGSGGDGVNGRMEIRKEG